ncbi:hypothetical protein LOTGIDRAFT_172089 [Lottia gigantea]|uniref:DOMON domain-containing protein n=1 Tax=Lottia gigantea TaxID=225164 RepID=V4B9Z0_LOTGI|nr:hypothetical protein LOTGIDRAFT_172089 [Lottia gigantea]ESP02432.1 hypothetical protein LOTGIDRAFT_172089 [Lottia gigantea]
MPRVICINMLTFSRATIVKDYKTFWFGVKAVVQAESATSVVGPTYQLPNISNSFEDISLTECGASKGCFLHPPSCSGNDCNLGVTYKQNQDETYSFEMFGPSESGAGWVGLAISEDRVMGSDQAFLCAVVTDYVGIQYSFNPAKYTVQELTQGYSGVETKLASGMIYCRFTRDRLSTIDYKGPVTFDLGKSGYLHLAHGLTYGELGQAKKHIAIPIISYKSVFLNDSIIEYNKEVNGAQSRYILSLSAVVCAVYTMCVLSL